MACTLDRPCGGLLKRVLVLPDATIYQCTGSSHTHRVGAPPPDWGPNWGGRRPSLPEDLSRDDDEAARKEAVRLRALRRRARAKVAKREAKKIALRKHLHKERTVR